MNTIEITTLLFYYYYSNGQYYKTPSEYGRADKYSTGCIVSLTLDLDALSLSYHVIDEINDVAPKKGILCKAGKADTCKYKWAVSMYEPHDCVEIIDVYSNNFKW